MRCFLWSSIRISVLLEGIFSFLVLVCLEWRWISWTRIQLFNYGLAFSNYIFFSVVLGKSMCIFAFGPSLSPSDSFVILFIHLVFLLCSLGCHIFVQNCTVSLASTYWYVFVSSPPHTHTHVCRSSFRCFGMSYFVCIVLPFVDISLVFLLSPVLSDLFPQVIKLFFLCCLFLYVFTRTSVFSFVLSCWPVFVDFLSAFSVEFLILVLIFSSSFFHGS